MINCTKSVEENTENENQTEVTVDKLAFTQAENDTIMNGDTSSLIRILTIYKFAENGDTIRCIDDSLKLRTASKNITPDSTDEALQRLIKRMYNTVIDPVMGGVGLAAPQVGINRNLIYVQRRDISGHPFRYYINPKIVQESETVKRGVEGCLSVPNKSGILDRNKAIVLEYDLMDGTHKSEVIEGYTAVIFQHEMDHLFGVLYIDYLTKKLKNAKLITKQELIQYNRENPESPAIL